MEASGDTCTEPRPNRSASVMKNVRLRHISSAIYEYRVDSSTLSFQFSPHALLKSLKFLDA